MAIPICGFGNSSFALAKRLPLGASPAVHHPDPNPYALRKFAELRPNELFPPYDLPGTQLFQDFCNDVIRRFQLQELVVKAKVVRIEPLFDKFRRRFRLWLLLGQSVIARRVVLLVVVASLNCPIG